MAYEVMLRPSADKALSKLPRDAQARLVAKAQSLADNPRPRGVKKLQGQLDLYRVSRGRPMRGSHFDWNK